MKGISNKTLFNIHGWLGLNLGLLLFVICFSGTFATLSSEVDWLLNADMRVEHKDVPVQWESMYQSLKQKYPQGKFLSLYKNSFAGRNNHFAATAYISLPNGQTRKVYLNPYTGQIQGDSSFFNVQRFFRSYHRRFFDGNRGILIITLTSFFLLFSALTGFLFYKGWLKNLFTLRIGRSIKMLFSDAHKLTGIWSLVFTVLIALTGIFYFAEVMIQAADNYEILLPEEPPEIKKTEVAQFGYNPELLPLDKYVTNAEKAFPGLNVSTIRLPDQPNDYVYVDGQAGNILTRDRANKVYMHPFTGEVVYIQQAAELNTAEFITDMADPLHFGYFGGLITKIIWFVFGLALSFAILSGTYLWYIRGMQKMERKLRRRRSVSSPKIKKEAVALSGFISRNLTLSRGAVFSTLLTLVYLISTGISTVQEGIHSYGPLPEERFADIKTMKLGPWNVEFSCEYPCTLKKGTSFFADFETTGIPNYTSFAMNVISAENDTLSIPFAGSAQKPSLVFKETIAVSEISELQLSLQAPEGNTVTQTIDLAAFSSASETMSRRFDQYPERAYPDVSFGVYVYITFFAILVLIVLVGWTWFLIKSTNKQRKIAVLERV